MWIRLPVTRIEARAFAGSHALCVLLSVFMSVTFCGDASATFDSTPWRLVRDIHVSEGHTQGVVGIILRSDIVEECLPDLRDLRLTTSEGALVPITIAEVLDGSDAEPIPARIFKVSRKAGKWTDIWVDKSAKVLTRGIALRTRSTDFIRKVEVRGADTSHEAYVIRVDGLIVDRESSPVVHCTSVFHPLNNFQYLQIRILDGDNPPLRVDGVSCYPPLPEPSPVHRISHRLMENRHDEDSRSTVVVTDLGEERLPAASVSVDSPDREFIKRMRVFGASNPSPEFWSELGEGTVFRIRLGDATAEHLAVRIKPTPYRYLKLEFSEGTEPTFTVDGIAVLGSIRMVVFQPNSGTTYRLYYDNPEAAAPQYTNQPVSFNVERLAARTQEIQVGAPRRNRVPVKAKPITPEKSQVSSVFWKALGVAMLLIGLLLLFSVMLKARSLRRRKRRRDSRIIAPPP